MCYIYFYESTYTVIRKNGSNKRKSFRRLLEEFPDLNYILRDENILQYVVERNDIWLISGRQYKGQVSDIQMVNFCIIKTTNTTNSFIVSTK